MTVEEDAGGHAPPPPPSPSFGWERARIFGEKGERRWQRRWRLRFGDGGAQKKIVVDDGEEWRSYLAPEKLEVLRQLEPWVKEHVLPLLKSVEASWQPSDLLPDPAALGSDGFHTACLDLSRRRRVCPTSSSCASGLNRLEVVRDTTGADATAWARWIRRWSAEENRHGDVERTVQRLIRDGMSFHGQVSSPFHGFVYVTFQERATAIAHGNTARLVGARGAGDAALAPICGTVAADEKRHEAAYTPLMGKLFEADPDASVRAMAYMMRRRIDMPTAFINDGRHSVGDFYTRFIAIAQQASTYTHLIRQWGVEELATGLSGEGRQARDYLCALPLKIKRMEEKVVDKSAKAQNKPTSIPINWIFDRTISFVLP
ncbi:hypothetical protein HU200_065975 [Digitaria exilis]|uniref:Uncharacterized protein n=1 Tax=Digitaria exilis TaxID=1010633 RepID=A0A834ZZ57_9POAL|nr:hypothetical protein HU200_065975 [Digitaria exilis]